LVQKTLKEHGSSNAGHPFRSFSSPSYIPPDRGIDYGKGRFVAVGGFGAIIQSDPVMSLQAKTFSSSGFSLLSSGEPGPEQTIQESTDLGIWSDVIGYRQSQGEVSLLDPSATNSNFTFYRIKPD